MSGSRMYVYGLAPQRDRGAVERYFARYVDPVYWGLGDRHRGTPTDDYEVRFVPAGTVDPDLCAGEEDVVHVRTVAELLDQVFARPDHGTLTVALAETPDRSDVEFADVVFTPAGQVIFGFGVDGEDCLEAEGWDGVANLVRPLLRELCEDFGCPLGFLLTHAAPPMTEAQFCKEYDATHPALRYPPPDSV